jgi:hypothetical protein
MLNSFVSLTEISAQISLATVTLRVNKALAIITKKTETQRLISSPESYSHVIQPLSRNIESYKFSLQ